MALGLPVCRAMVLWFQFEIRGVAEHTGSRGFGLKTMTVLGIAGLHLEALLPSRSLRFMAGLAFHFTLQMRVVIELEVRCQKGRCLKSLMAFLASPGRVLEVLLMMTFLAHGLFMAYVAVPLPVRRSGMLLEPEGRMRHRRFMTGRAPLF